MIFSSLTFVLVFLPTLILAYFLIPKSLDRIRKYILLGFSVIFYAAGEPIYIFLILGCVLLTWILSGRVEARDKICMLLSVVVNLLPLIVFKYAGFIIANVLSLTRLSFFTIPELKLPIGISFYTFQILAYVIDLYQGKVVRQKNIAYLSLYIMFFPQLIAGPIVRYQDVRDAIENNRVSWEKVKYGTGRFIIGLSKKVLIANQVGYVTTEIMSHPLESVSTGLLWLAVLSFSLQIYFDFSGYSDMAIGLGSIFGFSFPENFNRPYMSTSVSDFWRRWHMTLGAFFRDYVYIPMGGNRVSTGRWIVNVLVVWMLTGFWHGAEWNFAVWGAYYAVLLLLEKGISTLLRRIKIRSNHWIGWFSTIFLVSLGWGIFMAEGYRMDQLFEFFTRLFHGGPLESKVTIASMNLFGYLPYVVLGIIISFPTGVIIDKARENLDGVNWLPYKVAHDVLMIAMLLLCIVFIVGGSYNPFIYYRF